MIVKSLTVVTLSWTLIAAITLGLVTCESSSTGEASSSSSSNQKQRSARKYLELEDLNSNHRASGPIHGLASAEEVDGVEARLVGSYSRPKKFAKRSAEISSDKIRVTRQQQLQQQRARSGRQNQQKKQRPGFFWTLARVTFETFNDTRSAIQQLGQIINEAIPPEPARKPTKKPVNAKKPPQSGKSSGLTAANATTPAPTTTTEAELVLTRPLLFSLVRRNVKGLVRLFNIEWRDALNQSATNVQEFRRDLGKQIGIYLQDNPDAY